MLLVLLILSCTDNANDSKSGVYDNIANKKNLHAENNPKSKYLVCFDSLKWQNDILLKSYVQGDGVNESYFMTLKKYENAELYDTIRLGTINVNRCFANVIWFNKNWNNHYYYEKNKILYCSIDCWSSFRLIGVKFEKNGRVLLDKNITGDAYFIIHGDGIESPILRGLEQGFSKHYDFELQKLEHLSLTLEHIQRLITTIPVN